MTQQTNEFLVFAAKAVNAGHKDAADGELNPVKDFAEYIPVLLAAQPGLSGLGEIGGEQVQATIQDQELTKAQFLSELGDLDELDAYNLTEGVTGIVNLFSYIKRKAYEKGRADMLAEIKERGL